MAFPQSPSVRPRSLLAQSKENTLSSEYARASTETAPWKGSPQIPTVVRPHTPESARRRKVLRSEAPGPLKKRTCPAIFRRVGESSPARRLTGDGKPGKTAGKPDGVARVLRTQPPFRRARRRPASVKRGTPPDTSLLFITQHSAFFRKNSCPLRKEPASCNQSGICRTPQEEDVWTNI